MPRSAVSDQWRETKSGGADPPSLRRGVPRLCLATSYGSDFADIGDYCAMTLQLYAVRWGHAIHVDSDVVIDRPPAWHRVKQIPELFDQGYEFVLWLDADALIDATARNAALEQELTSLRSSRSWRVTAPSPHRQDAAVSGLRQCAGKPESVKAPSDRHAARSRGTFIPPAYMRRG
jgi:hypothetical protein